MAFEPDHYYPPNEVEARGIAKEQTLAQWRCGGRKGPAYVKVGSRVLYRGQDLIAWLEANRIEPASAA